MEIYLPSCMKHTRFQRQKTTNWKGFLSVYLQLDLFHVNQRWLLGYLHWTSTTPIREIEAGPMPFVPAQ